MRFPGFIREALAAFGSRPLPWLSGFLAVLLGGAVVYGLSTDPSLAPRTQVASSDPPYRADLDARTAIGEGLARAATSGKMLMVTLGANWCPDCLTLHQNLHADDTRAYLNEHFELVSIDVGDAAKFAAVRHDLGIDVNVIPVALFFTSDGTLIGDTLAGELKPSRHFSSRDIRDFLREVVDYHRIVSPDQRQ
jgi:thiol-disulfide isomerase/thioredoxin